MAQVKLTKMELRLQQLKLSQLQKYLPTLQLKKALLQIEVTQAAEEIKEVKQAYIKEEALLEGMAALFSDRNSSDFFSAVSIDQIKIRHENIAGVEIPVFEEVVFFKKKYSLFDTPIWYESAMEAICALLTLKEKLKVIEEKKKALEKELREVSIRVNLFEKIMIPRALNNIKHIKIFLGDQQLASISQAKVAKKKIIAKAALT
jgi:V/A-type H+/Na+-transporting ATPase subunit D